ncbi:DUF1799 domain-containing protein [Plasticicumulans sp.]|uniref:DUF1799 domain-containing protein n=1 Tax=Plasticicumulans sp. TaxID=2307179 RepID=UPI00322045A3
MFEVWPCNWPAVQVFCACATQWRWLQSATEAVRIGLEYTAVEAVMRMRRVPARERPAVLARVQVMEREALRVWERRRG